MTGLPSSIIKKYGVSKKAWAVFRGQKRSRSRNKGMTGYQEAKQLNYLSKKYRGTSMVKRRRKSTAFKSGIKGIMGGIVGKIVGVGGYILFETYVEPKLLSMANIADPTIINIAELGAGLWLSRKSGIVGEIGKAAVTINAYQLLYPILNKTSSSTNNGYDY